MTYGRALTGALTDYNGVLRHWEDVVFVTYV
jgi:hypothetical protein